MKVRGVEVSLPAVRYGVMIIAMFAGPCVIASQILADHKSGTSAAPILLFLGVVFGFSLGGFGAARTRPDAPLMHGALAAAAAFAIIQTFGAIRRLSAGQNVHPLGIAFNFMVAVVAAMIGSMMVNSSGHKARKKLEQERL